MIKWTLAKLHNECIKASRHEIYRRHRVDIFPSELWYSTTSGVALFKQSENGFDFGVNRAAMALLKNALEHGRIENAAVLFVRTDNKHHVIEIVNQITIDQLCNRLKHITPIEGKFGDFNWVDDNGNPRVSDAGMPFDDDMPF
jgi:hypothetical protein